SGRAPSTTRSWPRRWARWHCCSPSAACSAAGRRRGRTRSAWRWSPGPCCRWPASSRSASDAARPSVRSEAEAEPDVEEDVPARFGAAGRRTTFPGRTIPTAAAQDTRVAEGGFLRVERVAAPLPDVAVHVEKAVLVGPETLHRRRERVAVILRNTVLLLRRLAERGVGDVGVPRQVLPVVAEEVAAPVLAAAAAPLPLDLAGQPHRLARPLLHPVAELHRVVPADVHHRVLVGLRETGVPPAVRRRLHLLPAVPP